MKNILIATDFSPHSQNTINHVVNLIQEGQLQGKILLLNTYMLPPNTPPDNVIEVNDTIKRASLQSLAKEQEMIQKHSFAQPVSIETSSRMGTLSNVISQIIQKDPIDIVAMGKDGGKHVEQVSKILKQKHQASLLVTYLDE